MLTAADRREIEVRGDSENHGGNMAERVALYLQDAHDLRDGLDYVRYAEQRSFEAVWQAESRLRWRGTMNRA